MPPEHPSQDVSLEFGGAGPFTASDTVAAAPEDELAIQALQNLSNGSEDSAANLSRDLRGLKVYPETIRELFKMFVTLGLHTPAIRMVLGLS